jgi:hypothetical protein
MAFLVYGPELPRTSLVNQLERMLGESDVISVADPPGTPPGMAILLRDDEEGFQNQLEALMYGDVPIEGCRIRIQGQVEFQDPEPVLRRLASAGRDIEIEILGDVTD